jgi:hypothetical protein
VRDCFGLLDFRNLVAWTLVNKRVRNCFNGTWYIGTFVSFNLQRQWFAGKFCDGTEENSASELAPIYYSEMHARRAYPAPLGRAGVGSILANPDAQHVPSFRRWRFEMKLSPCFYLHFSSL